MKKLDSTRLMGLKKVELAVYGEETLSWFEIGQTVPDSFVITKADDSVTEEFIEEEDLAIEEIVTQKGAREVSWSTKNVHGDVFYKIMGGTYVDGIWTENPSEGTKEFALRATSTNDICVTIPRVSIRITGDLKFTKNSLSQLTLKGKQLAAAVVGDTSPQFNINYNIKEEETGAEG